MFEYYFDMIDCEVFWVIKECRVLKKMLDFRLSVKSHYDFDC